MRNLIAVAMAVLFAAALWAKEEPAPRDLKLAALALPFGQRADWQQWDGFLTSVVKKLGEEFRPEQREQLAEIFLDARYDLVQALQSGSSDPVPQLFLDAWQRLAPVVKQAIPGAASQTAGQYTSFLSAMDAAASVSGLGQRLGFLRITPEALRGAARLLGTGDADPLAYTVDLDTGLRSLLGFSLPLPPPQPSPLLEQGRWQKLQEKASSALRPFIARRAFAAEADFNRLNQWLPEPPELQDYLTEVLGLLRELSDNVSKKSALDSKYHQLYQQIVLTTAWQESCWRQFIKKGEKLTPLASTTGDVGLMQINRMTWRSLYDVKGLSGDISYNVHAGTEILYYYLTRYAIRKNEDKQPGGNLARATYASYNGGPRHLGRYRAAKPVPALKKVDDAFYEKFKAVSSGQELAVRSCYSG